MDTTEPSKTVRKPSYLVEEAFKRIVHCHPPEKLYRSEQFFSRWQKATTQQDYFSLLRQISPLVTRCFEGWSTTIFVYKNKSGDKQKREELKDRLSVTEKTLIDMMSFLSQLASQTNNAPLANLKEPSLDHDDPEQHEQNLAKHEAQKRFIEKLRSTAKVILLDLFTTYSPPGKNRFQYIEEVAQITITHIAMQPITHNFGSCSPKIQCALQQIILDIMDAYWENNWENNEKIYPIVINAYRNTNQISLLVDEKFEALIPILYVQVATNRKFELPTTYSHLQPSRKVFQPVGVAHDKHPKEQELAILHRLIKLKAYYT